ncbi:MAG: methyltransferase [Clostridia bacterium]|nr:methyltransferase [Clostridia bacterium]
MPRSILIAPNVTYTWPQNGAPPSADSFLLADFAAERIGGRVCDLCGGAGLISMLLCVRGRGKTFVCADVDAEAAELCRQNAKAAAFEEKLFAKECDVNSWRSSFSCGEFDAVVCNPPYHEAGGKESPLRANARSESGCSLEAVCTAAGGMLKNGGRLFICMKASRLAELMIYMRNSQTEPKRLRFAAHAEGHEPYLVLCEGIKGAAPGLKIMPQLTMFNGDGTPSAESDRIYYGIGE